MTVYLRPGSSVYQFEFVAHGERHRGSTGETEKDKARAFEMKERAKIEQSRTAKEQGINHMTMWEVSQAWLTASKATHKDHRNNESRVRKLFGSELQQRGREWFEVSNARYGVPKDLKTHEVTQAMLSTLKSKRLDEGCKPGTINREMSLLQSLLGFAESIGAPMPAQPIKWSARNNRAASLKLPETKGRMRWLTVEEERKVLDGLMMESERHPGDMAALDSWHLCQFLLDTGARYDEIAKLKWDVVDLERGTINLYRGKVDNESTLRLPSRTWAMLKDRHEMMKDLGFTVIFPKLRGRAWDGEDVSRGHATKAIQRHLDGLGGDRATPHALRHTFASRMLQAGVSLAKVSKLLGHASVAMTARYAHLADDALHEEALGVMERLHSHPPTLVPTPQQITVSNSLHGGFQVIDSLGEIGGTCGGRTHDKRIKSPPTDIFISVQAC